MIENYDVLIIGGGPIGLACGIEAAKAGLSYVIVEKGCLVNSLYHYPLNMTFFSTAEKLEIGNIPFISHLPKPNRSEAIEYYRKVADHFHLHIRLYEKITDIHDQENGYLVTTSRSSYGTKSIIIATGFYDIPSLLQVPGEHLNKVHHYYREPHPYYAQKIAVIGAANSAVDVALETYRKGAQVTMIIRGDKLSDRVKYWVKPDIENRIKEGSIKAYFNSYLKEIRQSEIEVATPEGVISIENDFVLAMTGYQPDFTLLEKAGIAIRNDSGKTPVYDTDTMETNRPNVYLAGVICGGLNTHKWFIENSRVHAEIIVNDLKKKLLR